jgi:23S rRNA (uridine2552-2'-O)-methyltransferase
MDAIADVEFIQGDFTEDTVFEHLMAAMQGAKADLVIPDMGPHMSGIADVDQPSSIHLVALDAGIARAVLKLGGSVVAKVFEARASIL